jgi:hypothetical protein
VVGRKKLVASSSVEGGDASSQSDILSEPSHEKVLQPIVCGSDREGFGCWAMIKFREDVARPILVQTCRDCRRDAYSRWPDAQSDNVCECSKKAGLPGYSHVRGRNVPHEIVQVRTSIVTDCRWTIKVGQLQPSTTAQGRVL